MAESELSALQRLVARAALVPRPLAEDAQLSAEATRAMRGSERMSPVERLDVYREQFWARHVHSL